MRRSKDLLQSLLRFRADLPALARCSEMENPSGCIPSMRRLGGIAAIKDSLVDYKGYHTFEDVIYARKRSSVEIASFPPSRFFSSAGPSDGTVGDATMEITSPESFQTIIKLSMKKAVVLDAYATWCGPCKMLDPILKAAIAKHAGDVVLAKLDIDNQSLAPVVQGLQVTSVPTMFMLIGGKIVDIKQGVMQPREIDAWIAKAVDFAGKIQQNPDGSESPTEQQGKEQKPGDLLENAFQMIQNGNGNASDIAPLCNLVLQHPAATEEEKALATAGLSVCAVLEGQAETAKQLIQSISQENRKTDKSLSPKILEYISLAEAWIELDEEARTGLEGETRSISELQASADANKENIKDRYLLSLKLFLNKNLKEAIDAAMLIVRQDKNWGDPPQAGKRIVAMLCNAVGSNSDLGRTTRKRLSNIWFI